MNPAGFAAHGDHAAVATAEPTAHHAFERYMADAREPHGHPRDRGHHPLGAARVHGGRRPAFGEMPLERRGDAAVFAGASVFGGEHERDAALAKEIEREELGARSRAVEQRGFDTSCDERLGENGERGEPRSAPASITGQGRPSGPRQAMRWPGFAS